MNSKNAKSTTNYKMDERFQIVFTILDKLVNEGEEEKKIGFIKNEVRK